jgi:hypothetical protein
MTVNVTQERYVYAVPSERNPRVSYRVDIVANAGASECSCRDWETRRWPSIKAGEPIGTRSTLCKHGEAARNFFLNGLLKRLAQEETIE